MNHFEKQLQVGKAGESEIANWLKSRGSHILPIYEKIDRDFKGPTLFASNGDVLIAPDMLAFTDGKIIWIEAKHKSAFTWHRISQRFVTGIDLHHYEQYIRVSNIVDFPVWILFLHCGGVAVDSPPSPAGLYGGDLVYLICNENHRHQNHGKTGMVYWAEDKLKKLANYPLEY